jgi:hypothetical protein
MFYRIIALAPIALLAVACNPPEGKDNDPLGVTLNALEGGGAVSLFSIEMGVDETARGYENEVEVTIGGLFAEGDALNMEVDVLDGLSTIASGFRTSSDNAESAIFTPDFDSCDGANFTLREDNGCDYSVAAIVGGDRVYSIIMGFSIRSQAPKGEDGEDVEVFIDATEAQPEASE